MTIGEKIQRCRKAQRMSQEELAGRLGVSRQAVSKWELNESIPDTENVIELGRIFGVSLDYLLKVEIEEPDYERGKAGGDQIKQEGETKLIEGEREGRRQEKSKKSPILIFLVVLFIFILLCGFLRWNLINVIYMALNLAILWGMVYLAFLIARALKKYIQR